MSKLIELNFDDIDFEVNSSQQFATVIFDRVDDSGTTKITVIKDGIVNQFDGDNRFNPSLRRSSSCVYIKEESADGKMIKLCTIQHKGNTLVEAHEVLQEEVERFFE